MVTQNPRTWKVQKKDCEFETTLAYMTCEEMERVKAKEEREEEEGWQDG